jgi:hypothetical protein
MAAPALASEGSDVQTPSMAVGVAVDEQEQQLSGGITATTVQNMIESYASGHFWKYIIVSIAFLATLLLTVWGLWQSSSRDIKDDLRRDIDKVEQKVDADIQRVEKSEEDHENRIRSLEQRPRR